MGARFTHRNEDFTCENCGRQVPPASVGCRNHCPYCLTSKHLDEAAGDRASHCKGLMVPIMYSWKKIKLNGGKAKGIVITYRCDKCGEVKRNKAAPDDNRELIESLRRCA